MKKLTRLNKTIQKPENGSINSFRILIGKHKRISKNVKEALTRLVSQKNTKDLTDNP